MKLNANSFFFRRYLGYKAESNWNNPHPRSICDVLTRFTLRTVMYLATIHLLWTTIYGIGWLGLFTTWGRNSDERFMYFGHYSNTALDVFIGMPAMLGQVIIAFALIVAVFLGTIYVVAKTFSWLWPKMPKVVHNTTELIGDVADSVRGKSCAPVTIINSKED